MHKIINNYLSRPERNLSRLMKYAQTLRVKQILEQLIAIRL